MSVKKIISEQYKAIVDNASANFIYTDLPKEGWLKTVRMALGMHVSTLAERLGVTRANVYKSEKKELLGGITLRQMSQIAKAMKCKFVYAILPHSQFDSIQDMINWQAKKKAIEIVKRTSVHMALEAQDLSSEQMDYEMERIMDKILKEMPSDFWDE